MAVAVVCDGVDMYDPRLTLKAVAAETIGIGMCVYIHSDGLVYVSDTDQDKCHGVALKAYVAGEQVTICTRARITVTTNQTPGANVNSQQLASGVGSAPDDGGAGPIVGWAMTATVIIVNIDSVSTT